MRKVLLLMLAWLPAYASTCVSSSPASFNFGLVTTGTVVTNSVGLTNRCSSAVVLDSAAVTGSDFKLLSLLPLKIPAGRTVVLAFSFSPKAVSSSSSTVNEAGSISLIQNSLLVVKIGVSGVSWHTTSAPPPTPTPIPTPSPSPTPSPTPPPTPTPLPSPTPGAPPGSPALFFSDLVSGPNTGGEANQGAFVTLWGTNFGSARGTVTVGGGEVAAYKTWSNNKISVQLGPAAVSGLIVVTVNSLSSNGLPFVVRPGNIFFVSPAGSDSATGSFVAPWKTIVKAKNTINAGDIAYLEDGVSQTTEDIFTAYLSMDRNNADNSGTAASPKALVAYPGAFVQVGAPGGLHYGIRTPNINVKMDYWVISQLHIIGGTQAMDIGGTGWRIIGNEMQCPGADDQVGCFEMSEGNQTKFYGNDVHNAGINPTSSKFYHAVYFSTDSNHIDVGWNHIHDNFTCRALQFHSSPLCSPTCGTGDTTGFDQFDLHVHDNLIHGDNCNGINFATVDPSKGPVEAYNNVIYNVGRMDPLQLGAAFSAIYVAGITNNGPQGTGTVQVYNNTIYNSGANNSPNAQGSRGAFSVGGGPAALMMNVFNNIVYQLPGELYIDGSLSQIKGSNNLWFGASVGLPARTSTNISGDPMFLDRFSGDFHLAASSPAIDSGIAGPNTDKDGVFRPQHSAFDLGAFEFR